MRVLIDTNIILDALLEREPFVREAEALFEAIESRQIEGYVTATTLTDIFYIVRKSRGVPTAKQAVSRILAGMEICTVDRSILEAAISSNLPDFEDAVQVACALNENLDAIITKSPQTPEGTSGVTVTRDSQDFADATLPILSAGELLQGLS
jgi:predicted nucleic acid-binding protein